MGATGCINFGGTKTTTTPQNRLAVFATADRGDTWVYKDKLLTPGNADGSIAQASVLTLADDASDTNAIYAGTENLGLFYSYTGAEGWTAATSLRKLSTGRVFAVAVDPKSKCTVYAGVEDKVFKSLDCNRTWAQIFKTIKTTELIKKILIDPTNSSVVFAAASDGTIYKTTNAGDSWVKSAELKKDVMDLAINKKDTRVVYAATKSDGLWRTIDGGTTWDKMKDTMTTFKGSTSVGYKVIVAPDKDNTVWYLSKFGLLRSDDGGNTWKKINLLTSVDETVFTAFAVNSKNSDEMYLSAGKNLYRSTDAGASWETRNLPSGQLVSDLKVHQKDAKFLYVGFRLVEQK